MLFFPSEAEMNRTLASTQRQAVQNQINLGLLPIAVLAGSMNFILITYSVKFFRRLGNAPYAIICSLTIADSLQTLLASPMLIFFKALHLSHFSVYKETEAHCKFLSSLMWLGKPASALNLALLSVDKLVWMKREYQYPVIMSRRKSLVYIAICWLLCLSNIMLIYALGLIHLLPHDGSAKIHSGPLYTQYANLNLCDGFSQQIDMAWYIMESLLFAVLPVALAASVTVILYTQREEESSSSAGTTLINTVWVAFTLLPLRVFYILKWFLGLDAPWVEFALLCVESLYSIMNPLLTFCLNEVYLKRVRGSALFVENLNLELFSFY